MEQTEIEEEEGEEEEEEEEEEDENDEEEESLAIAAPAPTAVENPLSQTLLGEQRPRRQRYDWPIYCMYVNGNFS